MLRHSCCEVRVMQLHDILQLRTSVILPEAISDGGLAPTTDTNLFLTTYRGGSHLPSDISYEKGLCYFVSAANNRSLRKDCLTGVLLSFVYHKFSAALHCVPLISASSRELAHSRNSCWLRHTYGGGLCSLQRRKLIYRHSHMCCRNHINKR